MALRLHMVSAFANTFKVPDTSAETVEFPQITLDTDILRLVYVSETDTFSLNGRKTDIHNRKDIRIALQGKAGIYGPYFNEENEYVICYSAPVKK